MADKVAIADAAVHIVKDTLDIAKELYGFIEKVRGDTTQTAFVKDLANTLYYSSGCKYNVMVFNLSLPEPRESSGLPSGLKHYSSVKAFHTTFGCWLFSGSGYWTNDGEFGYQNWMGIGNIKRCDPDGKPNPAGRVMKFSPI